MCTQPDSDDDTAQYKEHFEATEDNDKYNEFMSMFKCRKNAENSRPDLVNNFQDEMARGDITILTTDITNKVAETDDQTVTHIVETIVDVIVEIDEYDNEQQSDNEQCENSQLSCELESEKLNYERPQPENVIINPQCDDHSIDSTSTPIKSTIEILSDSSDVITELPRVQQETLGDQLIVAQNTVDMTLNQQITQGLSKEKPTQETSNMSKLDEQIQCHNCHKTLCGKTNLIRHLKQNNCLTKEEVESEIMDIQLHPLITEQNNDSHPPTEELMKNSILAQSESCEEMESIGYVSQPITAQNPDIMISHEQPEEDIKNYCRSLISSLNCQNQIATDLCSSLGMKEEYKEEDDNDDMTYGKYTKEEIDDSPVYFTTPEVEIIEHEVECGICEGLFSTHRTLEIHKELEHPRDKYPSSNHIVNQDIVMQDAESKSCNPTPPIRVQKHRKPIHNIKGVDESIAHILKLRQTLVEPPKKKQIPLNPVYPDKLSKAKRVQCHRCGKSLCGLNYLKQHLKQNKCRKDDQKKKPAIRQTETRKKYIEYSEGMLLSATDEVNTDSEENENMEFEGKDAVEDKITNMEVEISLRYPQIVHSKRKRSSKKKKLVLKRKPSHSGEEKLKEGIELIWNPQSITGQMTSVHKSQASKNISFLIKETGTKEEDLRIIKVENSVSETTLKRMITIFYKIAKEFDIDTKLIGDSSTGAIRLENEIDQETLESILEFVKSRVKGESLAGDGVIVSSDQTKEIFKMISETLCGVDKEAKEDDKSHNELLSHLLVMDCSKSKSDGVSPCSSTTSNVENKDSSNKTGKTKRKYQKHDEKVKKRPKLRQYKNYPHELFLKAIDKITSEELTMREASALYKIPLTTIQLATKKILERESGEKVDRRLKKNSETIIQLDRTGTDKQEKKKKM